jgi:hypothetical protein
MPETNQSLNPINDVRGAAELVRSLGLKRKVARALEIGANVIEPGEADVRMVGTVELAQETAGREIPEDEVPPTFRPPAPEAVARRKRHRGYERRERLIAAAEAARVAADRPGSRQECARAGAKRPVLAEETRATYARAPERGVSSNW